MKFGILTEEQIKKAAGGKLDKLTGIWHRDVSDKNNRTVEIVLGNRRDSSSPVRGGILTSAAVEMKGDSVRLMIWYDPLELFYESRIAELGYSEKIIEEMTELLRTDRDPGPEFDPVANSEKLDFSNIAAQIARWLLKFRGFRKLGNENKSFFELESFLNHECVLPAIYSVFDEADFDRSAAEKKRLAEVYEGLLKMEEPGRRIDRALNALRISNILQFSPESENRAALIELLKTRFGRISDAIGEIDQMKSLYRLTEPDGLIPFMQKLVLAYRMPGSWVAVDETIGIL